ncbi:MAG: hypothetical protein KGJ02_00870 [Verrucomicrobiota bacterium]|nr:hypothetical protein [Verrucomicrobiota bacterium]
MFWLRKKKPLPSVTFATSVWEKDWRHVLRPEYLHVQQVRHHCISFAEKLLVINNVNDLPEVKRVACRLIEEGILTRFVVADEVAKEMLPFFQLRRSDFRSDGSVPDEWIYYNALAPLSAVYECQSDYLLYLTGDVRLERPIDWVRPALTLMERHLEFKVANPTWNERYREAKRESYRGQGPFFVAKEGFSDQIFLVKREVFRQPIYGEIRSDAGHFPRGDVFEKRVFSYMKNRGWERITFRRGSYTHENIEWAPSLGQV